MPWTLDGYQIFSYSPKNKVLNKSVFYNILVYWTKLQKY